MPFVWQQAVAATWILEK